MMSEHINGWLAAYFDSQLGERRTQKVEVHLKDCKECRQELERLSGLRGLLQENPEASDLMSADRFVAQVGLRLQPRPTRTRTQRALSAMWISIPIVMLGIWAFSLTLTTLTGLAEFAIDAGLWNSLGDIFSPTSQTGFLSSINWRIGVSLVTGLISLSWLASWWISQQDNRTQKRTE
jgi:predicted anti-sigma-YlaC factor YlaD